MEEDEGLELKDQVKFDQYKRENQRKFRQYWADKKYYWPHLKKLKDDEYNQGNDWAAAQMQFGDLTFNEYLTLKKQGKW